MLKHTKTNNINASRLSQLLNELAVKISNSLGKLGERATEVPGLILYRCTAPTVPNPCAYEPSLLVPAQGRKQVNLGKTSYVFGQSRFLLTSLELPVVSRVISASEEVPYLAFFLKLDMSAVREILHTEEVHVLDATSGTSGMAIGVTTVDLVNSCCRMMDLLDAPQDIPFFAKLMSTLHHHFRALTAMTPLQFQKQLRLHAARQRMLTGEMDAASAAFEVGYESPSQFNREYRRFFGQPPMREIKALRDSKVVAITAV